MGPLVQHHQHASARRWPFHPGVKTCPHVVRKLGKTSGPVSSVITRVHAAEALGTEHKYSPEQLAFIERKRRYRAGEGPLMPADSECPSCNGRGVKICHACNGTGVNDKDVTEILKNNGEMAVRQTNGLINLEWKFIKGGPCWLCTGRPQEMGCQDCQGTGIKGFKLENYSGD